MRQSLEEGEEVRHGVPETRRFQQRKDPKVGHGPNVFQKHLAVWPGPMGPLGL